MNHKKSFEYIERTHELVSFDWSWSQVFLIKMAHLGLGPLFSYIKGFQICGCSVIAIGNTRRKLKAFYRGLKRKAWAAKYKIDLKQITGNCSYIKT